jgi:hypothetical protein
MTITTIGSGMGATLAMVEETSYGAVKASPTWTFYEPSSITPKKNKVPKQSSGLAGGRIIDVSQRRVIVERSGTLAFPIDVCSSGGFSKLLNQISSSYATGAAGSQAIANGIWSAGARLQPATPMFGYTHTFRNSVAGRSASFQVGTPTTDGVLRQADLLGVKPTKFTFDCKAGELLTLATEWDARVLEDPLITASYEGYPNGTGQTPYTQATPSYVVQNPLHFAQSQVQIGASTTAASSAALIDGVTGISLSIENKLNTGRQYHGNAGLKDEPIRNDVATISGTITSDYVNKTYWADAFYSDTPISIIWTLSAGALAGNVPALQFVLNNVFLNGDSPAAANKDIVNGSFPFVAEYDLTNEPLTVIFQTADATG